MYGLSRDAVAPQKLRGGYYPRIFFPGLYNAKERFLKNFETVYYLKALPGGWIFKASGPEDWQVVTKNPGRAYYYCSLVCGFCNCRSTRRVQVWGDGIIRGREAVRGTC